MGINFIHTKVRKKTKKKAQAKKLGLRKKRAGIVLLSHRGYPAVPLPLAGLTSVFGMGTGVPPPLKIPANCIIFEIRIKTTY
tara:strand:- start:378 stop:623 length:246 start_codon:yes stop_codon:yes gene_type:complete